MKAYKLMRVRRDGSIGPLFICTRMRIPMGQWLIAKPFPTKGYKERVGWHATHAPHAPHLSTKGRAWFEVELNGVTEFPRPECQGGLWYIAQWMKVLRPFEEVA